jgi:hypothetical protein
MAKFVVSRSESLEFHSLEEATQQYERWFGSCNLMLAQVHECGCIEVLKQEKLQPNQLDPKVLLQLAKDLKEGKI